MLGNKTVLITGAARGMGREFALEAARQGSQRVALTDIDKAGLDETADLVRAEGADVHVAVADLRSSADIRSAVDSTTAWASGLDVLVNNAGVLEHFFTDPANVTIEDLPEDVWDAVFDINLKAMWLATKFAAPALRASTRGPAIVNASSVAGMQGSKAPAYGASKGAVLQLTRTTAIHLAPVVRCNAFCPGSIETPMSAAHLAAATDKVATARSMSGTHLIPRMGRVEEVAKAVCWLASDESSFITGAVIPVDGGTTAWRGIRED
jgi:NAD(P)-dependent dehydrogenase (short-subunit alcohol dehydrogenase family)